MNMFTLPTGINMTNTYILLSDGKAIVIDPGYDGDRIISYVETRGATIEYILVTHGHYDHIGAVAELKCKTGAKVYISQVDFDLLKEHDFLQGLCEGYSVAPFDADVLLKGGEKLLLLGLEIDVMATSGHTPGGVCYLIDNDKLFSGDTLFRLSVGRTDFSYGDTDKLITSVRSLFELPGTTRVYPGHGEPTEIDFEKKYNPYVH